MAMNQKLIRRISPEQTKRLLTGARARACFSFSIAVASALPSCPPRTEMHIGNPLLRAPFWEPQRLCAAQMPPLHTLCLYRKCSCPLAVNWANRFSIGLQFVLFRRCLL